MLTRGSHYLEHNKAMGWGKSGTGTGTGTGNTGGKSGTTGTGTGQTSNACLHSVDIAMHEKSGYIYRASIAIYIYMHAWPWLSV